jgi:ribosomal protein L22
MAEEKPEQKKEHKKKIEAKPLPVNREKANEIAQQKTAEVKTEKVEAEKSKEEKKSGKKKEEKPKKYEAFAKGLSFPMSKKHSMYISNAIKGKTIDEAIQYLQRVIAFKQAVPFKGEIPHRKGPGMMSGRYPINASKLYINLLKGLKGNAIVNGLELERTRIVESCSNWASRPLRTGGRAAKRTNVVIRAKEVPLKEKKK